ncbi:MAG: LacI family transcriptional regulator [Flavobacteriaceae bacterium]|nr:MAG: LacI family transcriptional regulator [Flavobacteriaceae bacterium]
MKMKKIFLMVLSFICLLSANTGCRPKKKGVTIGISFETLQTEYWVASMAAIKSECERNGINYIVAVSNGDANRQFEQVNNFISQGVDGIVITPKDAHTIVPIIKAANRASIPIGIYNRLPADHAGEHVAVVADNYEITKSTVRYMGELARASGRKHKAMILIGDLGDINAIYRRDGFNDGIKEFEDVVEVVSRIPTEWNQEKALAGVTNALQANPDISFIFTSSDFLFPSIISALKNADKYHPIGHENHVIFGGFDGDPMAYSLLKEQYLDADGVQDVFYECNSLVQAILSLIEGGKVGRKIVDPGFVIHQKNLNEKATDMWGANLQTP